MVRDGMSCDATWLIREISRVYMQSDSLSRGATYSLQITLVYNGKMMEHVLQSEEWANIDSKALLTVHTMFVVILGLAWPFRQMAACRVAPEIKASKTFQDILGIYVISIYLNVIYVHRMLLLKIIALCVQEKDHIVQYMGICCTYLHIGMYNVNVLSFIGSHNVWQYGPSPMGLFEPTERNTDFE